MVTGLSLGRSGSDAFRAHALKGASGTLLDSILVLATWVICSQNGPIEKNSFSRLIKSKLSQIADINMAQGTTLFYP
jgi:hypothetical protein